MFYLNWLQFPQKADPTKTFSQDLPVKVLLYIPRAALGAKALKVSSFFGTASRALPKKPLSSARAHRHHRLALKIISQQAPGGDRRRES